MGFIDLTGASTRTDEKLDQMHDGKPYEVEGLKLEVIHMHGREVGLGVIVAELSWNDEIGHENVFDEKKVAEALLLVPRVKKVFGDMGMIAQVLVMHHINLGG
jgi:hypothetical protein